MMLIKTYPAGKILERGKKMQDGQIVKLLVEKDEEIKRLTAELALAIEGKIDLHAVNSLAAKRGKEVERLMRQNAELNARIDIQSGENDRLKADDKPFPLKMEIVSIEAVQPTEDIDDGLMQIRRIPFGDPETYLYCRLEDGTEFTLCINVGKSSFPRELCE